jgi:hypothetical protein
MERFLIKLTDLLNNDFTKLPCSDSCKDCKLNIKLDDENYNGYTICDILTDLQDVLSKI